jgi:peptide/nickel transport system ATP-binding protein
MSPECRPETLALPQAIASRSQMAIAPALALLEENDSGPTLSMLSCPQGSGVKPMASQTPVVEISGLSVDFSVDGEWIPALRGVSFIIQSGEVVACVGESGSGKSTAALAMMGLLPNNSRASGSVRLRGQEILGVAASELRHIRGAQIGMVFQEPMTALNPVLTAGFQIMEALRAHDGEVTAEAAKKRALELLGMVELPDPEKAFHSYPHQLSGGQRQRAMIAQALALEPALLIADEPTSALDVTVQAEILDLLRDLAQRLNQAVLLITHDMAVVADLADRVVVMKQGEIVEQGTTAKLFSAPQHPYSKALLEAVPFLGRQGRADPLPSTDVVISLESVSIDYPKRGRVPSFRAISDLTMDVVAGEVVGVVGESGSGKTTLARAILGLLPVVSGRLIVEGVQLSGVSPRDLRALRRRMGIVFQDPGASLNPRWPIGQSIAEPLVLADWDNAKADARVVELLRQVELDPEYRNRYPHELSGGQRQRVGVARALALNPSLVIADEPTSALDVSVQAKVLALLGRLQRELGFATVFISHDLAIVQQLAHRIAVLHNGRLVEWGLTEQVLNRPAHPYTKQLIEAVPVPDPALQRARREARAH